MWVLNIAAVVPWRKAFFTADWTPKVECISENGTQRCRSQCHTTQQAYHRLGRSAVISDVGVRYDVDLGYTTSRPEFHFWLPIKPSEQILTSKSTLWQSTCHQQCLFVTNWLLALLSFDSNWTVNALLISWYRIWVLRQNRCYLLTAFGEPRFDNLTSRPNSVWRYMLKAQNNKHKTMDAKIIEATT